MTLILCNLPPLIVLFLKGVVKFIPQILKELGLGAVVEESYKWLEI